MFDLPSFDEIKTAQPVRPAPVEKKRVLTPIKAVVPEKKLKVAGYCRVSTDMDDQKTSYEIQRQHCLSEVAKHDDWEFCGIYCDIVSGTKAETRPELQLMLAACEKGEINLILTKSISRFARNTTDLLEMVRSLTAAGAAIIFDREHIDTRGMTSEFLLSILASLAEDESHSISSNCRWGMQKRFQDGSYRISTAPYGYDLADGSLVINERESEIVREIFTRYTAGDSMNTIAETLNARGVPSKRAGEVQHDGTVIPGTWSAAGISKLIRSETYIGDLLMQKTYKDHKFNRHRNKGEFQQFYATDHHPAIISRETYEQAQALREQKRIPRKPGGVYLFTGRLTCGCCGAPLRRCVSRVGTVLWVCSRHRDHAEDCPLMSVKERELMETVRNRLVSGIPLMKAHKAVVTEEWRKETGERLRTLEDRMSEIDAALSKLDGTGAHGAEAQEKRNRLKLERVEIQREIERITDNRITETEELIQQAKSWNGSSLDFAEKITVFSPDDVEIRFKCGLVLPSKSENEMTA